MSTVSKIVPRGKSLTESVDVQAPGREERPRAKHMDRLRVRLEIAAQRFATEIVDAIELASVDDADGPKTERSAPRRRAHPVRPPVKVDASAEDIALALEARARRGVGQ